MNLGEIKSGQPVDLDFNTSAVATGAPITLAGSPAVSVYRDNDTTEFTTGVTLSVDFDSKTGKHHVRIVTTDRTVYLPGSTYTVWISAGTVDGVSVVGKVLARFTISPIIQAVAVTGTLDSTHATIDFAAGADDKLIGRRIVVVTGTRKHEVSVITDYANGTPQITFAPALTGALANGDIIWIY